MVTLNPADKGANIILTSGNLVAQNDSYTGVASGFRSTIGRATGKWYFEVSMVNSGTGSCVLGFLTSVASLTENVGYRASGYGWFSGGNRYHDVFNLGTASCDGFYNYTTPPDKLMFAIDCDAHKIWIGKNGLWYGHETGADPETGSSPAWSSVASSTWLAAGSIISAKMTFNFGATAFNYTMPLGYSAFGQADGPVKSGGLDAYGKITTYRPILVSGALKAQASLQGFTELNTSTANVIIDADVTGYTGSSGQILIDATGAVISSTALQHYRAAGLITIESEETGILGLCSALGSIEIADEIDTVATALIGILGEVLIPVDFTLSATGIQGLFANGLADILDLNCIASGYQVTVTNALTEIKTLTITGHAYAGSLAEGAIKLDISILSQATELAHGTCSTPVDITIAANGYQDAAFWLLHYDKEI